MGFSTIAAFVVLLMFTFAALAEIYSGSYEQIKMYLSGIREKKDIIEEISNTNLEITQITTIPLGTTHDLIFIVKNSGSVTLNVSKFDVLIDGVLYSFDYNVTILYPENSVEISVNNIPGGNTTIHRLKLVAENGYSLITTYEVV